MTFNLPVSMAEAVRDEARESRRDLSDIGREALGKHSAIRARMEELQERKAALAAVGS